MNMSLGGGKSAAVNAAINQIRAAGVLPVVAAGNDNVDGKMIILDLDSPLLSLSLSLSLLLSLTLSLVKSHSCVYQDY